VRSEEEEKK